MPVGDEAFGRLWVALSSRFSLHPFPSFSAVLAEISAVLAENRAVLAEFVQNALDEMTVRKRRFGCPLLDSFSTA